MRGLWLGSPRPIAAPAFALTDQALKPARNAGIELQKLDLFVAGNFYRVRNASQNFPQGPVFEEVRFVFFSSKHYSDSFLSITLLTCCS